ncbi:uncharacterized protein LOC132201097 isoform X2 [Neocloeon triangulifer]|uniref:uncharacterized protein LOC132201097 isoform X2 n=1 Tax=Neocloeon triangulifer TaxID=2078957 RepID=UPI00286F3D83|nr:uncharacterized protein LOC132201097 isoform X2 [Neocloeon triangulifer]
MMTEPASSIGVVLRMPRQYSSLLSPFSLQNPSKCKDEFKQLPMSVALLLVVENTENPEENVDFAAGMEFLIDQLLGIVEIRGVVGVRYIDYPDHKGTVKIEYLEEALQMFICKGHGPNLPLTIKFLVLAKNGKRPAPFDRNRELQPSLERLFELNNGKNPKIHNCSR